jgi:hypothetical protein
LSWSGCDSSPNSREIAQPSRLVSALRRFEQPSNPRATRTKHQTPARTSDVPLRYRLQIVPATKGQKKTGPSISSVENDQRDHQPWKLTFENTAFGYGVGRICDRTSVGTVLETVTHSFSAFANHSQFFFALRGYASNTSKMPHITTAMERSMRRRVGDVIVVSLRPRDIIGEASTVKNSFSSWDNCMKASYCKSVLPVSLLDLC